MQPSATGPMLERNISLEEAVALADEGNATEVVYPVNVVTDPKDLWVESLGDEMWMHPVVLTGKPGSWLKEHDAASRE